MAEKRLTAKEYALHEKLDRMVEAGFSITRNWVATWMENLRYFYSDQLHGYKRHKDWSWIIINYLWPSAIQEIAKLAKNNPRIICEPLTEDDAEATQVWQGHLQWAWENALSKRGMRYEQIHAIMDGKVFGYRVSKIFWDDKCYWDREAKEWKGEVKHKLWHPAFFWADPQSETVEDAESMGTVRWVSLDWAQQRWPKFKDQLAEVSTKTPPNLMEGWGNETIWGSKSSSTSASASAQKGHADAGLGTWGQSRLVGLISDGDKMSGTRSPFDDTAVVKIEEIYFRDYEERHSKQEEDISPEELLATGEIQAIDGIYVDNNGKEIPPEKWPKRIVREWDEPIYPDGRYIIRCEHITLNPDPQDQIYPYAQWPFVITPHYLIPHMWQGTDAVQMYKTAQDMINVTVSHLTNMMKQYGDPKVLVEDGAISVNPKTKKAYKIGAGAGSIVRLVRGALGRGAVKFQDPPAINQGAMMLYQLFAQEFKNISGLQSVGRGEKEPGEMTATQAAHLAISSNDRIALQNIYEESWVRRICKLVAEIAQAKYDPQRFVRIVGEDRIQGIQQITNRLKLIQFDVKIEVGSQLPFDPEKKQARYLQAYQLLQSPVANPLLPEVLRTLEISEWKSVLQRHKPYQVYLQFVQLYEKVASGEMTPQQAVQIIANKMMQTYQGEVKEGQRQPPEATNAANGQGQESAGRNETPVRR